MIKIKQFKNSSTVSYRTKCRMILPKLGFRVRNLFDVCGVVLKWWIEVKGLVCRVRVGKIGFFWEERILT